MTIVSGMFLAENHNTRYSVWSGKTGLAQTPKFLLIFWGRTSIIKSSVSVQSVTDRVPHEQADNDGCMLHGGRKFIDWEV